MVYTRAQIKSGDGLFTSGEWTLIWRVGPDQYVTTSRSERPGNPRAELVAGGRRHTSHAGPKAGALFSIQWDK
jgi:hypothetical protein